MTTIMALLRELPPEQRLSGFVKVGALIVIHALVGGGRVFYKDRRGVVRCVDHRPWGSYARTEEYDDADV